MAVFKSNKNIIIPNYKGKTTSSFLVLIILEHLYCVNRSYLVDNFKTKILCNIIFICTIVVTISAFVYDFLYFESSTHIGIRLFQALASIELVFLAVCGYIFRNSFVTIKRFDEKCGVDDVCLQKLRDSIIKSTIKSVISLTLDLCGAMVLFSNPSVIVSICLTTAAHDAEMTFCTALIEAINSKLERIERSSLMFGSKIYKHLLLTILNLSEEFTTRILLMIASTFLTSVIFSAIIMLVKTDMFLQLFIILLWMELKSLYLLWKLCLTAAETKLICDRLGYYLASRLALYPKDIKSKEHRIARRLMKSLLFQQLYHTDSTILNLDLSVPIDLLDVTVNYLLIIVQIYMALE